MKNIKLLATTVIMLQIKMKLYPTHLRDFLTLVFLHITIRTATNVIKIPDQGKSLVQLNFYKTLFSS